MKSFLLGMFCLCVAIAQVSASTEDLIINEFCASNTSGLSINGTFEDWIELRNCTNADIPLAGWSLTDDANDLHKFTFPETTTVSVRANAYFVIFASGSDVIVSGGQWQANFSLSKSGEYLALVRPDGTIADELSPAYPEQVRDVSYGRPLKDINQWVYFETPTPRRANNTAGVLYGKIEDPVFSHEHGLCSEWFSLSLSTSVEGANIYYTTDGSEPTTASKRYSSPIFIASTTVIRARAYLNDHLPSDIVTQSYIFPSDIASNQNLSRSVRRGPYQNEIRPGLTDLPTISLVTAETNLYGSSGIFSNYGSSGEAWERPVSVELLPSATDCLWTETGFQIDGGIRVRGATGRSSAKKSVRLIFGSKYDGDLEYPLFGTGLPTSFSKVDLRTEQNNAWASNVDSPWQNTFGREVFARDSQFAMGDLSTHSRYYNVYINGTYWGIYMTQERGEADFAATYLGGSSKEYDALKSSSARVIEVKDGNNEAYDAFYRIAINGFSGQNAANYYKVLGMNADGTSNPNYPVLLDEKNLIHYIILTTYIADVDSPLSWINIPNNINAIYHRTNPAGWQWLKHDAELSLGAHLAVEDSIDYFRNASYWGGWTQFNPMDLHRKLIQNPVYRLHFMDEASKILRNNGALTYTNSLQRWNDRIHQLDRAIVPESGRWGNTHSRGYTKDSWLIACHQVSDGFLVGRENETLALYDKHGWSDGLEAPALTEMDNVLEIKAPKGVLFYTTNGVDPRTPSGDLSRSAYELRTESDSASNLDYILPRKSQWRVWDNGTEPDAQDCYVHLTWESRLYSDYEWSYKIPSDGLKNGRSYLRKDFVLDRTSDIESAQLNLLKGNGTIRLNGSVITPGTVNSRYFRQGRNLVTVVTTDSSAFDVSLVITHKANYWNKATLAIDDNTHIKVRYMYEGQWSPLAELDKRDLNNPDCSSLRLTEMMYAADCSEEETAQGLDRDDFAWLEFRNIGESFINLKGATFTSGIEFTFPDTPLAPGAYLVLVKNPTAFATRYDTNGMQIVSGYSGNLARKGETLTLVDTLGNTLCNFTYSNKWFPETDREGYTLNVIDTEAMEGLWNSAANWRPSLQIGGTPGTGYDGTVDPPVVAPIVITRQPENINTGIGRTILLRVEVTGGTPITYQWLKDGQLIAGATESQYLIDNAQEKDNGNYCVLITNPRETITSKIAVVCVLEEICYSQSILRHRYSFNKPGQVDDSVNGANGTLFGNAAVTEDGFLTLDGEGNTYSSTDGSFVALPPELIANWTSFSVEMWVRANEYKGPWMRLFDFGNTFTNSDGTIGSGHNYTMMTWNNGNDMRDGVRLEGVEKVVTAPTLPIGDGVFHHIVYVYDADQQKGYIYADGVQTGVGDQPFNPTQWGGCPNMWLGKSQFGPDPYFAGDYDEFRLYEGTLTAEEVAENYRLGANELLYDDVPEEPMELDYSQSILRHRYSFNKPGQVDDSVNGANGTLFGNAAVTEDGFLTLDGEGNTYSFTDGSFVALPSELIANWTSFSVEMWTRANEYKGPWMRLFDFGNTFTNSNGTIGEGHNYTMMTWRSGEGDMRDGVRLEGVEKVVTASALPIGDGVFHHIVYVYDANQQKGYIYTDGVQTGVGDQPFNPTQWGGCPNMWLGKSQFGPDPYFAGDYDEFRLYEGTLTEEEIAENYRLGANELLYKVVIKDPVEPSLVWLMQEGTLVVTFTGTLQTSTNLIDWTDAENQTSPQVIEVKNTANLFLRVIVKEKNEQ